MSKRPSSRLSFGSVSCGGSPTTRSTRTSSLGRAVGDVVGGKVRDPQTDVVAGRLGLRELLFRALELLFHAAQLLELFRRRLALHLRARAELVDARQELPPALVGGEPGVELLGRPLAREAAPELVRLGAGCTGVDHGSESR
jgi:hypothetical protein